MNQKKIVTWHKVLFELKSIVSNPFINIFGVGFPIFLAMVISKAAKGEISNAQMQKEATTQIFLGIGTIIPMATVLMGYAVSHSLEIEKGISERMSLFGISLKETVLNRIIAQLIFMSVAFGLFFLAGASCGFIAAPDKAGIVLYVACILALTVILFMLGHGIATLCRKFGLTYFVAMMIYFVIMICSGMMGMTYDQFPKPIRVVAKLLPTTYINDNDFVKAWLGNDYNFGPMIQAFLFMGAFVIILLIVSMKREER